MTKEQELRLLDRIEALIAEAPADSYIRPTFAGVPEICRRNIENDFGICPVDDLEQLRKSHADAEKEVSQRILRLEHERDAMAETIKAKDAEISRLKERLKPENRLIATTGIDRVAELEKELEQTEADGISWMKKCNEKDAEIMRLKAEIYDLRKECGK